jgi:anaerobic ribonucleoside-triphosphate reductase activating protein
MNVYAVKEFSLHETSGISFNVYLSGCHGYCEGCHSDHTWDFNSGSYLDVGDLVAYMKEYGEHKFDHICILGGEPLDQPVNELRGLLIRLRWEFPEKPLWLYTHFELDEVAPSILEHLDFIKTGKYEKDLPEAQEQYGVFLVSSNQKVHKLKGK